MMYPREVTDRLNKLSKEVFGASSRWKKLVEKGYVKQVTEELDDIVPGENGEPDTVKKVQVASRRADGAYLSTLERHTLASVEEYMLDLKKKRDEFLAMIEKQRQEQEAKRRQAELEQQVHREVSGATTVG
jgi:hypothetical protein